VVAGAVSGVDTWSARPALANLRVAIAHDWLVQYAGSERVVEAMLDVLPQAQLLTTVLRADRLPPVLRTAEPSLLDRIPGARDHHEWFLPLMPLSWRLRRPLADLDVVISSSHACAKAVRVDPGTPHICYCHTPMRYAWSFDDERHRVSAVVQGPARLAMRMFRRWDRTVSDRVTVFLANSSAVAQRISRYYGRPARILHPPVDIDFYTPRPRERNGFLYVGRLTGYKRPDLVVAAFARLPYHLTVVGSGPMLLHLRVTAPQNVSFVPFATRDELRELYRSSVALVYPVNEDFGIAMAEAQACGTPVIGLASGGALDIVQPGETGWLVERQEVDEVCSAVRRAVHEPLDSSSITARACRFSRDRFHRELGEIVSLVADGVVGKDFT
jgi:glycosyltransferase involved in cell wall biosynthesis